MQAPFDFQALWVLQPGKLLPSRSKYEIFNDERQLLATALETGRRGRVPLIGRNVREVTALAVTTAAGEPLFSLILQRAQWLTELQGPAGEVVGRIRTGGTRRRYTLLDETGETLGEVVGDLGLKNFSVTDSGGGKLAQVRKTRAGLFKEMLTPNDHYKVDFIGPVRNPTRTLVAMVPIVLDLTLYEPM